MRHVIDNIIIPTSIYTGCRLSKSAYIMFGFLNSLSLKLKTRHFRLTIPDLERLCHMQFATVHRDLDQLKRVHLIKRYQSNVTIMASSQTELERQPVRLLPTTSIVLVAIEKDVIQYSQLYLTGLKYLKGYVLWTPIKRTQLARQTRLSLNTVTRSVKRLNRLHAITVKKLGPQVNHDWSDRTNYYMINRHILANARSRRNRKDA